MRTNKDSLLKQWLTASSVAFGVSCGCTLPFTQNLAQSALFGIATVPGAGATMMYRLRKRKQRSNRQIEMEKLRLNQLKQQGAILERQLQLKSKDRQALEAKVAQLHSLAVGLTDRVEGDRLAYQQLETQITSITQYCQERQNLAAKLDRNILEKQARLLEIDTDFHSLKLENAQLQTEENRLHTSIDRAQTKLTEVRDEIGLCLSTRQELEQNIRTLQSQIQELITAAEAREHTAIAEPIAELDREIESHHLLLHKLDAAIDERQQTERDKQAEIDKLEQILTQIKTELLDRERESTNLRSQLGETETQLKSQQAKLKDLTATIREKQTEIESSDRSLKMVQLELSSKQAELDNLELKVSAKIQAIESPDPWNNSMADTIEPKPPTVDRKIAPRVDMPWQDLFIDNPHLIVLQHIEKHGTITEAEASTKLGNARSVRQFANKLEEYTRNLPFAIRVESSAAGNRYIKENHN